MAAEALMSPVLQPVARNVSPLQVVLICILMSVLIAICTTDQFLMLSTQMALIPTAYTLWPVSLARKEWEFPRRIE